MKKLALIAIIMALVAAAWYALSPDGPLGYDEGARLAIYTSRAADKLQHSSDDFATFIYTPKYGNDQAISVEFTRGDYCPNSVPGCSGTTVVVRVAKGKSGAGYSLGHSASVPHRLELNKTQGPIRLLLRKENGAVEVAGLE
jgi:hypothetical protein